MFELIVIFSLVSSSPSGVSSQMEVKSTPFQFDDACEAAASKLRDTGGHLGAGDAVAELVVSASCIKKTR